MPAKRFLNFASTFHRRYSQSLKQGLICEHLKGSHSGIAIFGLHRPEQKNAISVQLLEQLLKAFNKIQFENDTRVLIIRSLVPGIFCAGIMFTISCSIYISKF